MTSLDTTTSPTLVRTRTVMRKVVSSNITAIGYNAGRRALYITFKNTGTYRYSDVPPRVDADLQALAANGGSVGRYFAEHIKHQFPSEKAPLSA